MAPPILLLFVGGAGAVAVIVAAKRRHSSRHPFAHITSLQQLEEVGLCGVLQTIRRDFGGVLFCTLCNT